MKTFDGETFFRSLADETRLRLLNLMAGREVCVCYFVEILGTSQPKISRHLAYLRKAGIVAARRDGKWMHYKIVEPGNETARRLLADIQKWLAADPAMKKERARLAGLCCATNLPVRLKHAPRPIAPSELHQSKRFPVIV